MTTHYYIGTMEFRTRAAAIKKAKEYIAYDGSPVRITVEKEKKGRFSTLIGRYGGPPEIKYSEFTVSSIKEERHVQKDQNTAKGT